MSPVSYACSVASDDSWVSATPSDVSMASTNTSGRSWNSWDLPNDIALAPRLTWSPEVPYLFHIPAMLRPDNSWGIYMIHANHFNFGPTWFYYRSSLDLDDWRHCCYHGDDSWGNVPSWVPAHMAARENAWDFWATWAWDPNGWWDDIFQEVYPTPEHSWEVSYRTLPNRHVLRRVLGRSKADVRKERKYISSFFDRDGQCLVQDIRRFQADLDLHWGSQLTADELIHGCQTIWNWMEDWNQAEMSEDSD